MVIRRAWFYLQVTVCLLVLAGPLGGCKEQSSAQAEPSVVLAELHPLSLSGQQRSLALLVGPEAVAANRAETLRFCVTADEVAIAKLGDGEAHITVAEGQIDADQARAMIFRETVLQTAHDEGEVIALDFAVHAAVIVLPVILPLHTIALVVDGVRVGAETIARGMDAVATDYRMQVNGNALDVKWNRAAIKNSSKLCIDVPVRFQTAKPPGLSLTASYTVHNGDQSQNVAVLAPFVSLAGAGYRALLHSAEALGPASTNAASEVLDAVRAAGRGRADQQDALLRCVEQDWAFTVELRTLCISALGLFPQDAANARIALHARFDRDPRIRAAAAVTVSRPAKTMDAMAQWIEYYRTHNDVAVLQSLFQLHDESIPKNNVVDGIAGLHTLQAEEWSAEHLGDSSLAPELRLRILQKIAPGRFRTTKGEFSQSCSHVITFERNLETHQLRTACFALLTNVAPEGAHALMRLLYNHGTTEDRCLVLTTILESNEQPFRVSMLGHLMPRILSGDLADQHALLTCARQPRGEQLTPFILDGLRTGAASAARAFAALSTIGGAGTAPGRLVQTAKDSGTSLAVRRDILAFLLSVAEPTPMPSRLAVRTLLTETFADCDGGACRALLGVPHVALNESGAISALLSDLVLDDTSSPMLTREALAAAAQLAGPQREQLFNTVVQRIRTSTQERSRLVTAIRQTEVLSLKTIAAAQLCRLEAEPQRDVQDRATTIGLLEQLAPPSVAQNCFISSMVQTACPEELLANADVVSIARDPELRARVVVIFATWLAAATSSANLAHTAFAALATLGETNTAITALGTWSQAASTWRLVQLAMLPSLDNDRTYAALGSALHRRLLVPRHAAALLLFACVCLSAWAVCELHRIRTFLYRDIVSADVRTTISIVWLAPCVLAFGFPSTLLAGRWAHPALLYGTLLTWSRWGILLVGVVATAVFARAVATLSGEMRAWHGSGSDFQTMGAWLLNGRIQIPVSSAQEFVANGEAETYQEASLNPEIASYPSRVTAWKQQRARIDAMRGFWGVVLRVFSPQQPTQPPQYVYATLTRPSGTTRVIIRQINGVTEVWLSNGHLLVTPAGCAVLDITYRNNDAVSSQALAPTVWTMRNAASVTLCAVNEKETLTVAMVSSHGVRRVGSAGPHPTAEDYATFDQIVAITFIGEITWDSKQVPPGMIELGGTVFRAPADTANDSLIHRPKSMPAKPTTEANSEQVSWSYDDY